MTYVGDGRRIEGFHQFSILLFQEVGCKPTEDYWINKIETLAEGQLKKIL